MVSLAVDRAKSYGLRSERDVCRFLNLSAVLGADFDRLPDFKWIADELSSRDVSSPSARLDRVFAQLQSDAEREQRNQAVLEEFRRLKGEA